MFDLLLFATIVAHTIISPYTKVEETFQVNNTYDFLTYGMQIEKFDYHEFPGVVPRTFTNSILNAILSWPPLKLLEALLPG